MFLNRMYSLTLNLLNRAIAKASTKEAKRAEKAPRRPNRSTPRP